MDWFLYDIGLRYERLKDFSMHVFTHMSVPVVINLETGIDSK